MAGEGDGDGDAVLRRSGAHHYGPLAGELAKLSWTHHQHDDASASGPSGEVGPGEEDEASEEAARLRLEAVDRRNAKYLSRAFFVQMVAQREIEVSEDKWQEVLKRQARLLTPVGSLAGKPGSADPLAPARPLLQFSEAVTNIFGGERVPLVHVATPYALWVVCWGLFMICVDMTVRAAARRAAHGRGAG